ncbi:MAG TPA: hypothetical protein PLO59_10625, partial [Bacteroidia bacterium]|nr:hypothetical protein [Bacteroidia bacterium]
MVVWFENISVNKLNTSYLKQKSLHTKLYEGYYTSDCVIYFLAAFFTTTFLLLAGAGLAATFAITGFASGFLLVAGIAFVSFLAVSATLVTTGFTSVFAAGVTDAGAVFRGVT